MYDHPYILNLANVRSPLYITISWYVAHDLVQYQIATYVQVRPSILFLIIFVMTYDVMICVPC